MWKTKVLTAESEVERREERVVREAEVYGGRVAGFGRTAEGGMEKVRSAAEDMGRRRSGVRVTVGRIVIVVVNWRL